MHDHVGLAQQPLRAQCQQVCTAGPGAYQIDDARAVRPLLDLAQQLLLGGFVLSGQHQVGDPAAQGALQHPAPEGDVGQPGADRVLPAFGQRRQAADGGWDQRFDPGAEQAGQHRCGAAGTDGDLDW